MMSEHAHMYAQIGDAKFQLHLMDLKQLRSKYSQLRIDVAQTYVNQLQRRVIIEQLLFERFGRPAVKSYQAQCVEWDSFKVFVETP